jgi:hypothetical protein
VTRLKLSAFSDQLSAKLRSLSDRSKRGLKRFGN